MVAEDWRIEYHTPRPHSAHGLLTPSEFAHEWATTLVRPTRHRGAGLASTGTAKVSSADHAPRDT